MDHMNDIQNLMRRYPDAKSFADIVNTGDKLAKFWAGENNKNIDYQEMCFLTVLNHGYQYKALQAPTLTSVSDVFTTCDIIGDGVTVFSTRAGGFAPAPHEGSTYIKDGFWGRPTVVRKSGTFMWTRATLTKEALHVVENIMIGKNWRRLSPSFEAVKRTDGTVLLVLSCDISESDSFRVSRWFAIIKDNTTMRDVMTKRGIDDIEARKAADDIIDKALADQIDAGGWYKDSFKRDCNIGDGHDYTRWYDDETGEYVVTHRFKIIGRTGNTATSIDIMKQHKG